jgi:hypothetical protein
MAISASDRSVQQLGTGLIFVSHKQLGFVMIRLAHPTSG